MEKAVVYARYSSHNQTEQSIDGQLAAAQKYAALKGYRIVHEYCDRESHTVSELLYGGMSWCVSLNFAKNKRPCN